MPVTRQSSAGIRSLRLQTNLFVEVKVGQWQLYSFANFLFLHIQASDICVGDIRFLMSTEHSNRRICFRRQNVHQRVRVSVEGNGRGWFEFFAIKSREDSDHIVGSR